LTLQIKPINLSKSHLPFTAKYAFMLSNIDLNFSREVTVSSEFCLFFVSKGKKRRIPLFNRALDLASKNFPEDSACSKDISF